MSPPAHPLTTVDTDLPGNPTSAPRFWPLAGAAALLGALAVGGGLLLQGAPTPPSAAALALAPSALDVCVVAPPTPYDASLGLPLEAARSVPAGVRCPVCGMYPAKSPDWAAQVIFANGDAHFFDSPLSLFLYLGNVARYSPGRSASDIVARYVTDGAGSGWTDAATAYYVHGSSARGPMRAGNLPAFASAQEAERFAAARGGRVLAFESVDAALLASLDSSHHGGH